MNKRSKCTQSQACQKREYTIMHEIEPTYLENKTVVLVRFETTQVEYQNTYISYSLISSMFDSLLQYTRKYPLRGYILGVPTHTTALDSHRWGDEHSEEFWYAQISFAFANIVIYTS